MSIKKCFFTIIALLISCRAFATDDSTTFVYVNGGYDNLSNYSIHESDIFAFKNNLSKGSNIKIFNARGDGTKVVVTSNQGFEREADGRVALRDSQVKNGEKATRANIENYFSSLHKNSPEKMTVVWGDHGGQEGVALWDQQNLNAEDIRSLYSNLPESTVIRAIHIHCYAGAAMSGPNGKIPLTDAKSTKNFIDKKYPANRCGLSLSDNDEVGQYRGWLKSDWGKDLKTKNLSLTKLKSSLLADESLNPTIMLTSDYFLRDLRNGICNEQKSNQDTRKQTEADTCQDCNNASAWADNKLKEHLAAIRSSLCTYQEADSKALTNADYYNEVYREHGVIKALVAREFVNEKYPDFYKSFTDALDKIDSLQQKIAKEKDPQVLNSLIAEFEKIRDDYPTRYDRFLASVGNSGEFTSYFNNKVTRKWLEKHKKRLPELKEIIEGKQPEYFDYSAEQIQQQVSFIRNSAAKSRAAVIANLNKERQSMAETLFSDPKLRDLKERYENILKCENSTLN